jgi:hypothetical protein
MNSARERFQFLDLSGYGFSGKHAMIDLVRELDGYHVEDFKFEFILFRIQGGLLDLRTALVDDWSPIRSNAALNRFKRLIRRVGAKNSYLDPRTWATAVGFNYDEHYAGRFFDLSENYIRKLTEFSWIAPWPYAAAEWSGSEMFFRKLGAKLGLKGAYATEQFFTCPDNFDELTRDYVADVLSANVSENFRTIVLHNGFEPFNPYRSLLFFDSAKCIVVDRDPRDNYVAGLWYTPTRLNVDSFIKRYRAYRQTAERYARPSPQVMRLRFEDLVLNYEDVLPKVFQFLGVDSSAHSRPKQYFNPAISRKNIGIWRSHSDQCAIETIGRELASYCYAEG